ncbi:MAG: PAS domain-containing sensor histidine kinase [Clostridia bacterium]|nr:PAS domain-containing sensor histidine kinase [Clostridia bacterium]
MKEYLGVADCTSAACFFVQERITGITPVLSEMIGYTESEVLNKTLSEFFNNLLRATVDFHDLPSNHEIKEGYIFTKILEPREVLVQGEVDTIMDSQRILFVEKSGCRFEESNPFLHQQCVDNLIATAVYTADNLVLLKANQKYLDLLENPYNIQTNSIGKRIDQIITGWKSSPVENYWMQALHTGKSVQVKEYMHTGYKKGITYWDSIITPVTVHGKVKFLVSNTSEVTDRVLCQKQLDEQENSIRKKNEELHSILDNITDALFLIAKDGSLVGLNKTAQELCQCSSAGNGSEDVSAIEAFDLSGNRLPFEDTPIIRMMNGEKIDDWVMRVKNQYFDRYISVNGTPFFDKEGNFQKAIYIQRDITDFIKQSREIEQRNKQLEAMLESISDGILITDLNGNILEMSEEARRQFFHRDKMVNLEKGTVPVVHTDIQGNPIPFDQMPAHRAARGEKVRNERIHIKSPRAEQVVYFSSTPIYDENGNIDKVLTCINDISDLVQKEKEIQRQKEQLQAIIENMSDFVFVFDRNYHPIIISKTMRDFLKMFNVGIDHWKDLNDIADYFDENGHRVLYEDLPYHSILKGEKVSRRVYVAKSKINPDLVLHLSITGAPIFDDHGNVLLGVLCAQDVTEHMKFEALLKSHQEQVLHAEKLKNEVLQKSIEMKDEFLSLISHEFKTPITVIHSAIQAMELICKDELSAKAKGFIGKIRQNSYRQLRLVNNILDITRMNSGHIKIHRRNMDIVFLTRSITESVGLYAQQKGVNLLFASTFQKRIIGIDEEMIERVLLNLLSNAIKFTPSGKSIVVKVCIRKGKICIDVKDEGLGIPRDKKKLIFERFGQVDSSLSRQAEGTGIGLSLAKLFVEALGGSISVKSQIGKGSRFTVLLPITRVVESKGRKSSQMISDHRLIQATAIEFSDIYL